MIQIFAFVDQLLKCLVSEMLSKQKNPISAQTSVNKHCINHYHDLLIYLASKNDSDPFIASFILGTKCIIVVNKKEYEDNLADVGYQFKRYVTGKNMMDTKKTANIEQIHTIQIGTKKVLFHADVDTVNSDGSLVKAKTSNPRYWGTRVMFQMISCGSSKLCHGRKSRRVLTRVTMKSLSEVSLDALQYVDVKSLQRNILDGMDAIQSQLKGDKSTRSPFVGDPSSLLQLVVTFALCFLLMKLLSSS